MQNPHKLSQMCTQHMELVQWIFTSQNHCTWVENSFPYLTGSPQGNLLPTLNMNRCTWHNGSGSLPCWLPAMPAASADRALLSQYEVPPSLTQIFLPYPHLSLQCSSFISYFHFSFFVVSHFFWFVSSDSLLCSHLLKFFTPMLQHSIPRLPIARASSDHSVWLLQFYACLNLTPICLLSQLAVWHILCVLVSDQAFW